MASVRWLCPSWLKFLDLRAHFGAAGGGVPVLSTDRFTARGLRQQRRLLLLRCGHSLVMPITGMTMRSLADMACDGARPPLPPSLEGASADVVNLHTTGMRFIVGVIDSGRREANIAQLQRDLGLKGGIHRWPPALPSDEWARCQVSACGRNRSHSHTVPYVAVAHINAWRQARRAMAAERGADAMLVFEDDALFSPAANYTALAAFEETVNASMQPGGRVADFVLLGGCGQRQCFHAYWLSRAGLDAVMDEATVCYAIDSQPWRLQRFHGKSEPAGELTYAVSPARVSRDVDYHAWGLGGPPKGKAPESGLVRQVTLGRGPESMQAHFFAHENTSTTVGR